MYAKLLADWILIQFQYREGNCLPCGKNGATPSRVASSIEALLDPANQSRSWIVVLTFSKAVVVARVVRPRSGSFVLRSIHPPPLCPSPSLARSRGMRVLCVSICHLGPRHTTSAPSLFLLSFHPTHHSLPLSASAPLPAVPASLP